MALLHVDFFSRALSMCVQMDVILPQETRGQIAELVRQSNLKNKGANRAKIKE